MISGGIGRRSQKGEGWLRSVGCVTGFSKEGGAMYVTAEARWSAREGERKRKKKFSELRESGSSKRGLVA